MLLASALWVGLVFYSNVRERRSEVGILRALGARTGAILRLFLTKALVMGCAGGVAGYAVGASIRFAQWETGAGLLDPRLFVLALCTAVVPVAGGKLAAGVARGAAAHRPKC